MSYKTVSQITAVSKETAVDTTGKPYGYLITCCGRCSYKSAPVGDAEVIGRTKNKALTQLFKN
jgi:hypothetical protein